MAWTDLDSTPGSSLGTHYIDGASSWTVKLDRPAVYIDPDYTKPTWHPGPVWQSLTSKSPLRFPDRVNGAVVDYSAGGGGGGSTRPSSGFLYPRGDN